MERIDDSIDLKLLQRANLRLADFFERFSDATATSPDEELPALLGLHDVLESVGVLLDARPHGATSLEVCAALDCYRRNLVRLHGQLAIMEQSAMAHRGLLDRRQRHLSGARAWATASRALG